MVLNKQYLAIVGLLLVSFTVAANYDYIIIGGGTAGSIWAEKLSRDPLIRVLLLEKGDDVSELMSPAVAIWNAPLVGVAPANISKVSSHNYFANFHKSQENNLGFRSLDWAVGELLGGGSSINGNAFGRATADDLAGWNNELWSYEATLDDWKALENCQSVGPACDPDYHGFGGPIATNIFAPSATLAAIANAAKNVFNLTDNADVNGPVGDGLGYLPRNVEVVGGVPFRQDSYSKALKPVLASRPNLVLRTQALVKKINVKINGKNEVIYDYDGAILTDKAELEVVLAAGTFGNPQILLLSGIGDPAQLQALGIDLQVNNSQVGKNLRDSVLTSMVFVSPVPAANNTPGAIAVAYYKSPGYTGPTTNMEVAFASLAPAGNIILVQLTHLVHSGVGEVKLYSTNPHYRPMVTFNLYSNPAEALALVDQFNKTRQTFASLFAQGLPFGEASPGTARVPATATATDILNYLAGVVGPEGHAVGTCSLNKVVNGRLQLIDGDGNIVPGIRIGDNSIVPQLLSKHATASTAMLIAETGSRLVLEDNVQKRSLGMFESISAFFRELNEDMASKLHR